MPISSPPSTRSRSASESPSIASRSFGQRRLAGQLADDVPVGRGDRQLGPDRRRALRHAREDLDAVEAHARPRRRRRPPRRRTAPARCRSCGRRRSRPAAAAAATPRERKRRTASVGNENGSASRIAPAAPSRSGRPDSAPEPSSISSTVAWNGSTSPSPSDAAHTETAVPSSTSRASEITPPAPQPTSVIGASISCTAASVDVGRRRDACRRRTGPRGRRARPSSPRAAAEAASSAPRGRPASSRGRWRCARSPV